MKMTKLFVLTLMILCMLNIGKLTEGSCGHHGSTVSLRTTASRKTCANHEECLEFGEDFACLRKLSEEGNRCFHCKCEDPNQCKLNETLKYTKDHQIPTYCECGHDFYGDHCECKTCHCAQSEHCEAGWQFYEESCFRAFSTAKTWNDAEAGCQSKGAHLVTVDEHDLNDKLTELYSTGKYWIGCQYGEGGCMWRTTGSQLFLNFGENNPELMECAYITTGATHEANAGKWSGDNCLENHNYICQKDPSEE